MKKEKDKNSDREYWQTINKYRWEFLRRSEAYKNFYNRFNKEYLIPLKHSPPQNVLEWSHADLSKIYKSFADEAHKSFGLSYVLIELHYPDKWLSPIRMLKSREHIIFADYQQYDSSYSSLQFLPHITVKDGDTAYGEKYKIITFEKLINPLLLPSGERIREKTLKLQAKMLSEHLDDFLKTWDLLEKATKKERTQTNAMHTVADTLNISFETVRSRIRQARKLITEAAQARFYTPTQGIS